MAKFGDGDVKPLFSKAPALSLKLVLLGVLSLVLMFADQRSNQMDLMRSALSLIAEPVQYLASVPGAVFSVGDFFESRADLSQENDALRRQVLVLRAKTQRLEALTAENRRIRALLESSERINQRVLIASVMGASPDPYRHYIVLNKGRVDGVFEGQALIDAYGIVGQITEAGMTTSTAILITDPNHGIPVEVNRTGLRTVAQGNSDGPGLTLPYLPTNTDLQVGDLLVSSGLGGRYPPGYPVGKVTRMEHQPGEYFLTVGARPAAHLRQGREVLLVWREEERLAQRTPSAPGESLTGSSDVSAIQ